MARLKRGEFAAMSKDEQREHRNEISRRWRARNPGQSTRNSFKSALKTNYGMTLEDYATLSENQKGVCAICYDVCKTKNKLCVDHCHNTGKVRGLLCHRCNVSLGLLDDDIERLKNMINYLKGEA